MLKLDNVTISYKNVPTVQNFNLDMKEGQIVSLVGESGSGKTTVIRAVLGLLAGGGKVTEGSITFEGEDLLSYTPEQWRKLRGSDISMIFQEPMTALNPLIKVGKQVRECLLTHQKGISKKEAKSLVLEQLKSVGLPDVEDLYECYPHQLSGGQRQRVMIAMAFINNPALLIADEPTTALDVTIQTQIMDLMRELKEKSNTAIILVTHDLGVVANFADRIQVMYAGQVVERGTAREIFYESKHPYTWALLSSVPKVTNESKEELYALKGTPPDLLLPLHECPFASRCEYCMGICKEKNPMETSLSDTHKVSCWLQHPKAPKVKSFYDKEAK